LNNKFKPEIIKLEFPKEELEEIDAMIEGKPSKKIVKYWSDKGMNIQQKTKCYTSPALKERMRTIVREYKIGVCHICQEFPLYKVLFKMDGINLVEYYCQKHFASSSIG
jgi:hypothetical protein